MDNENQASRYDPDGETQPFLPEDSLAHTRPSMPSIPIDPEGLAYQPQPAGETQPVLIIDPLAEFQAIRIPTKPRGRKRGIRPVGLLLVILLVLYFLAPLRTNIVLLGIDRVPDGTALGRSDTIILTGIAPLPPSVEMLSIPRDLYLDIPGVGENRINTAHFFAEAQQPGSGPRALAQVVQQNFGVRVPYYVRVRFDGFLGIFDAMGGVDVNLPEPMSGYQAGPQHLDAAQSLAFVRDRSGTDDFFRMAHTQMLVKAAVRQMLNPTEWSRLPSVGVATMQAVDTNLPVWLWPRLGTSVLLASLTGGIDNRTIAREMVTPYVTDGGAQVLLPDWDQIHALVAQMFRRF